MLIWFNIQVQVHRLFGRMLRAQNGLLRKCRILFLRALTRYVPSLGFSGRWYLPGLLPPDVPSYPLPTASTSSSTFTFTFCICILCVFALNGNLTFVLSVLLFYFPLLPHQHVVRSSQAGFRG